MNIFLPLGFIIGLFGGLLFSEICLFFNKKYNRNKDDKAKDKAVVDEREMKENAAKEMQELIKSLGGDAWIRSVENEHIYSLQPFNNWRHEWNRNPPIFHMKTTLTNKK